MGKETECTPLWEMFRDGQAYQQSVGMTSKIPTFRRFYEGDQWAKPTDRTKNMPRPVVNIIKMICRNKKAAVLSTPVKIVYKSERMDQSAEKFNRFAQYIQKEIGQDLLDKQGIDDGTQTGTYVYHYYWDAEAKGKKANEEGGLRCEMIDPLNIFFADPTQPDEQKQKWILIVSRESVEAVRAKADKDIDPMQIVGDDANDDPYHSVEQEGSELCTVLTRYFRKDGEVYIEKATRGSVVNKPFPLTPDVEKARKMLTENAKEDAPNASLPDNTDDKQDKNLNPKGTRAYLYPIVVGNYEHRHNSIYGLGEVEGLIPNQKAINFNLGMILYSVEQTAYPKVIADQRALQGQKITNDPGQVLYDYTNSGGAGIRYLTGANLPPIALEIIETITALTRTVTGSSEVMTGETIGAGMSGAAIAQLQSQALQPVEELKATFWGVKEKQGKVLAQFFKLYYYDKEFTYTEEIDSLDEEGHQIKEEITRTDRFSSRDFADIDYSVVVEATGGTKSSSAGDINALDVALANKAISIKEYYELYPEDALSNRTEILKKLESDEANKVAVLEGQLQMIQQELQNAQTTIQSQQKAVDDALRITEDYKNLKQKYIMLYREAEQKISAANQQIAAGNQQILDQYGDAQQMAMALAGR